MRGFMQAERTLLSVAVLLVVFNAAQANPLPEETWNELAEFVPEFARSPSPEAAQRLAFLLRESPGAVIVNQNAEIVRANMDLFAPHLVEAHRPGVPRTLTPRVADVYLEMADHAHREPMLEVLRSWLDEVPVSQETRSRYEDVVPVTLENQIIVAEILSDANDAEAIPAMRALQATIPEHTEAWVHLDQAVMRIESPLDAGFLVPTEGSGVRLTRSGAVARVLVAGQAVSDSLAARILDELSMCKSHNRTALTRGGVLVRVEFPDGLVGKLTWSEGDSFIYTDNTRENESRRERVGVQGSDLAATIGGVLRTQGDDSHPLAKMPN